jgi:hypothetical protein
VALEDRQVVLDGHAAWIDIEPGQQVGHREGPFELEAVAVEGDDDG